MEAMQKLLFGTGAATSVFWISISAPAGVRLGKLQVCKIRIGVAGVLFSGLVFAHYGVRGDHDLLHFLREFGLILFVYAVGINAARLFSPPSAATPWIRAAA